jgi:ribosomal protein L30E
MNLTTKLANIELLDWQGTSVKLGDLWREKSIVLVFIRHFG